MDADDSGSMVFEEGGERIQDLKVILGRVAEVATMFDDDGIVIRFMNWCAPPPPPLRARALLCPLPLCRYAACRVPHNAAESQRLPS